jgi:hypothetical protein
MGEVSGLGERFGDVGKHVRRRLIDACSVRAAVHPFAVLGERG